MLSQTIFFGADSSEVDEGKTNAGRLSCQGQIAAGRCAGKDARSEPMTLTHKPYQEALNKAHAQRHAAGGGNDVIPTYPPTRALSIMSMAKSISSQLSKVLFFFPS
jgi:hypothetical protein